MNKEITNCHKCGGLLTNHVETYIQDGEEVEVTGVDCISCSDVIAMQKYIDTKILTTGLIDRITLDLFDISRSWCYHNHNESTLKYKLRTLRELIDHGTPEDIKQLRLKLDIWQSYVNIGLKIKEFEHEVWFSELQSIVKKSNRKGMSANGPGSIKVMTFSMCARTMITIEDQGASITMIFTEDADNQSTMSFRGINAIEWQAVGMIDRVIEAFNKNELKFEDDSGVSYCGM